MKQKAIKAIKEAGILLVFPIKNQSEPLSLWSCLHPRTSMRWEWDVGGDGKVFALWSLREELSRSRKVIYSKWYQGRATFFSKEIFVYLLSYLRTDRPLPSESQEILDCLEQDSPLSPKQLKELVHLQGKWMESTYQRNMKVLWSRLLILGFGEMDDSSFPSLKIGATQSLFEDLWQASLEISTIDAENYLQKRLGEKNKFWIFAKKLHGLGH